MANLVSNTSCTESGQVYGGYIRDCIRIQALCSRYDYWTHISILSYPPLRNQPMPCHKENLQTSDGPTKHWGLGFCNVMLRLIGAKKCSCVITTYRTWGIVWRKGPNDKFCAIFFDNTGCQNPVSKPNVKT